MLLLVTNFQNQISHQFRLFSYLVFEERAKINVLFLIEYNIFQRNKVLTVTARILGCVLASVVQAGVWALVIHWLYP